MTDFLRRLWTFVRPYRARLFMGLGCGVLFAFCNGLMYGVVKLVFNLVFKMGETPSLEAEIAKAPGFMQPMLQQILALVPHIDLPSTQAGFVLTLLMIPTVMFFRVLFNYLNIYMVNWASTRAVADLRAKVFAHLQSMPLSFFNQSNTGELIARVTNDTASLRQIIGTSLASIISDPVTIIVLLTILFIEQPALTFFSVIVLPTCIIPITIYGRRVRRSARAMQTHAADMNKLMHESFTGHRIIKAYNLEDAVNRQFRDITKKFISHTMRVVRANEIPGSIIEVLSAIGTTLILIYLVMTRMRPDAGEMIGQSQDPGAFIGFILAIFVMYKPIKSLARLHNQLVAAQAASQRVFELLDTKSTVIEPANPVPLSAASKDIVFENIEFAYGEKPILRGINLTVKAGQLVALVGKSGSGKTTLVNLLLRFYDPQRGSVRIGDVDIRQVSSRNLRDQIAMVTQETILFHDTIRHNIALGRPNATDAEIEAAARAAHAHEFIIQKPEGYQTVAGEKGATLSVGQRQRITIARALLKNAPILVLDEATSALDTESERAVQVALEELMQGRTTICIAHRLSTIQRADLIVVLSEGQIVETGTHEELVSGGGVYQKLYELSGNSRLATSAVSSDE